MVYKTSSDKETEAVARDLAKRLEAGRDGRRYIALFGEMGVGKTAFVRGFASHFGITSVKSPTYTVVNEYVGRKNIFHFDMYRIESDDDLYSIGFDEYLERDGYSVSEWSENIEELLPDDAIRVTIRKTDNDTNERIIEIGDI
jgi:tRNA threonylcarbamoyladenosine biosynthesis protein TsaE